MHIYTERLRCLRILSWHGRPGRAHGRDARATIYGALCNLNHRPAFYASNAHLKTSASLKIVQHLVLETAPRIAAIASLRFLC